jgi:hypothetical protein
VCKTTYGLDDDSSDLVGISIAGRSPVLEVALTLLGAHTRDTNAGTTIGNTPVEFVDAASLMSASQTSIVTLTVDLDVLSMACLEFLHSSFNVFHATIIAHLSGRDVGMETSSIPVTWDGLGSEGDLGAELFSDTVEEEAGKPELITN